MKRSAWGPGSGLRRLVFVVLTTAALMPGLAGAVGDRGADGDFARRDSFHFTLFQDVDIDESAGVYGSRKFEQDLLRELEAAFDRLDQILDLRPEGKLVVYVWDPALFDAEYRHLFRFPAAGFYGGAIHIRGDTRITPGLVRVLHHELVHAAFDAEAPRLALPAWMNEGIAEWFEARALGKRSLGGRERVALGQLARAGQLFSLADLGTPSLGHLGPEAASVAYLQAYAFIEHLVATRGEGDLVRFWKAVVRSRSLDRGARRAYRSDMADLEAAFARTVQSY